MAGYSPKSAKEQATRLLTYVHIQAAIREAQRRQHDTAGITSEQLTAELAKIGLAEVAEPIKLSHKLKALELLVRHVSLTELERRLTELETELRRGRYGHRIA